MTTLVWPDKDPDEVLDYVLDWYTGKSGKPGPLQLDSDTISTSTWIVPSGITKNSDTNTNRIATIWLSGGSNGKTYAFVNRIVTAAGRTYDQTVKLKVKSK